MNVTIDVKWHPETWIKDFNAHVASGLNAAAAVLGRQMQNNIVERPGAEASFSLAQGSRGGGSTNQYVGPRVNHLGQIGMQSVVSRPGQFPSYQFGNMRSSIRTYVPATARSLSATVGSRGLRQLIGFDYAWGLEFGYRSKNGYVAARPWARPAMLMAKGRMISAFLTAASFSDYGQRTMPVLSRVPQSMPTRRVA